MSKESTTPDLAELVRRLVGAFAAGDLDAAMSFYASDAVLELGPGALETFEGRAAIRRHLEDWWAAYEEYEFELVETGDLGHGVTFGIAHQRARLSGSTRSVEARVAAVVVWDDGKVVRNTMYADIDMARAAAERLAEERGQAVGPR
jgi:ketosteroid isomerase-like protein